MELVVGNDNVKFVSEVSFSRDSKSAFSQSCTDDDEDDVCPSFSFKILI